MNLPYGPYALASPNVAWHPVVSPVLDLNRYKKILTWVKESAKGFTVLHLVENPPILILSDNWNRSWLLEGGDDRRR